MKKYELIVIVTDKVAEKDLEKTSKELEKAITNNEGKIEENTNLGTKRFASPIKKSEFGTYLKIKFSADKDKIKPINADVKSIHEVIRFIITKAGREIPAKKPAKKVEAEEKAVKVGEKAEKIEKIEAKPVKKEIEKVIKKPTKVEKPQIKKEKIEEKPTITKEIESEEKRMEKLDEELNKILGE